MRISELARRAGLAPSAIRWYEQAGVLPAPDRTASGYREFSDADVSLLRLIVSLRRLGVAPLDAGRLARLCLDRGRVDIDLAPLIAEQRAAIGARRDELDRLDAELIDLEATIRAAARPRPEGVPSMTDAPIRVLFVCTGNSARSQIAQALLQRFGGNAFEVHSAGSRPKGVHPMTIRTLADTGIDWSGAQSRSVNEFLGQSFDYVITVCDRARTECPVFPGSQNTLHWGLDDPAEVEGTEDVRLAAFGRTRMEIALRLRPFIEIALRAGGRRAPASAPA